MKKKIAIVGAGFAGLSLAYFLADHKSYEVHIFDPLPVHKRTSGMAAGLLHPFTGASANLNPFGWEGFSSSMHLIQEVEAFTKTNIVSSKGILRIALSERQRVDFKKTADQHESVEWWNEDTIKQKVLGVTLSPGIWIKDGVLVDCKSYLKGLHLVCESKGVRFHAKEFDSNQEESFFDCIVLAGGAQIKTFEGFQDLPLTLVKGQVLEMSWPKTLPPLSFPINSQAYLFMTKKKSSCLIGATFERDIKNFLPDKEKACHDLFPKLFSLFPSLQSEKILSCKAGIRVSTSNHLPLISHVKGKYWVFTGLGGKGLLYHAFFAKKLFILLSKQLMKASLRVLF